MATSKLEEALALGLYKKPLQPPAPRDGEVLLARRNGKEKVRFLSFLRFVVSSLLSLHSKKRAQKKKKKKTYCVFL